MKGFASRHLCFCALVIAGAARVAVADSVGVVTAGENYGDFYGAAVDPSTGKIYVRTSYTTDSSGSNTVSVYDNGAALFAHAASQTLTTAGGQGTYIAANQGKLYGRYEERTPGNSPSDTTSARWDAATGATEQVGSPMPGMGGSDVNVADTFTVGLFTAVNWMQDQTGLYVLGHNAGESSWQLDRMNSDLTIAQSITFDAGPLGYAFMINGKLFTSSNHESQTIDHMLDLSTGAYTAVNFTWTGLSDTTAVDDAFYDVRRDTLYLHDYDHGTFYAAANASQQFHAASPIEQAPSTPLPGAATAGAALLGGLAAKRRPRRPVPAE
jgi:hypothetical protein